jgi:hypothetical protein
MEKERVMYPTLGDLQTRLAEFHHDNRRREASSQFRFGERDLPNSVFDLGKPAFPQWRTAAQVVFAVSVTTLTLLVVYASIVAISRA